MIHNCIETFETRKIDDCSGQGYNRCKDVNPMILEVYSQAQDGTECYFDDWIEMKVKYCPFCGLKADDV